jgi:hypothetical protein
VGGVEAQKDDDEQNADGGEHGEADTDEDEGARDAAFDGREAGGYGVDGKLSSVEVAAEGAEFFALVVQLAVEAGVRCGDLAEITAEAFCHLLHGGAAGFGVGGLRLEEPVGHGKQARDVRCKFNELRDRLRPHYGIVDAISSSKIQARKGVVRWFFLRMMATMVRRRMTVMNPME